MKTPGMCKPKLGVERENTERKNSPAKTLAPHKKITASISLFKNGVIAKVIPSPREPTKLNIFTFDVWEMTKRPEIRRINTKSCYCTLLS